MADDHRHRELQALYVISVAAELAGVHPQTLRIYERKGLVDPARTGGGSRRYSDADIAQLRRIQELTNDGLNLAGVKMVLELEAQIERLRSELAATREQAAARAGADPPAVPARPRARETVGRPVPRTVLTSPMAHELSRIDAAVVDQIGVAVIVCDLAGTVLDCNQEALRLYGRPRADVIGRSAADLAGVPVSSEVAAEIASNLVAGKTWAGDFRMRRPDGSTIVVHTVDSPMTDAAGALAGVVSVSLDVTERVRAERRLAVRSAVTDVLEVATSTDAAVRRILEIVCTTLDWEVGTLWTVDDRSTVMRSTEQWFTERLAGSAFIESTRTQRVPRGVGLPGRVWATREPAWIVDVTGDREIPRADPAREVGLHHAFAVPLFVDGAVVGVIELFASGADQPDTDLLELMSAVGGHLGQFIERKRAEEALRAAYARASHLAATLQQSLLPPDLPAIAGVELATRYHPGVASLDVGGDFYDVFDTGGDWAVVIGDVCGKGAEAAALTALARHTVRAAAMRLRQPSAILRMLNDTIVNAYDDERFCTVLFTRLVTTARGARLVVASGGHPLPLVVRGNGTVEEVGAPGTLLGSLPDIDITESVVELEPGDLFVAVTDGVLEARARAGGEFFGSEGFRSTMAGLSGQSADAAAAGLLQAVLDFAGDDITDDLAIVTLRVG